MVRYSRKSKLGQFKRGHKPHYRRTNNESTAKPKSLYKRLTKKIRDMANHTHFADKSPDAPPLDRSTTQMNLRPPKAEKPTKLEEAQKSNDKFAELEGYRFFHAKKVCELFNEAIKGHREKMPKCDGDLIFDTASEIQWGAAWREKLTCMKCGYLSPRRKLYTTVASMKRGAKAATINVGIQVGMLQTGMGNSGLRKVFNAANCPAPGKSSMQKTSNKVCKMAEKTNKDDMKRICNELKEVKRARGLCEDAPINVEMDARYNNPISGSGGATPFQAGTQMTNATSENLTGEKQVINVQNNSKLCQKCSLARGKGKKAQPHDCTMNLKLSDPIGDERKCAKEGLSELLENGVTVNIVTTDPDGSAFRGAEDLYVEGKTAVRPRHNIDTVHVTRNTKKKTKNTNFSNKMFKGCKTKKDTKAMTKRFANDLGSRCHAEHAAALKHYRGNTDRVSRKIPEIKSAMIQCYRGSHHLCVRSSFVCKGKKRNNWVVKSSYLPNDFELGSPTDVDLHELNQCIDYRLGRTTLTKTQHLLNSNKSEAVQHSISSVVPKNKTFSRNYSGRVHAKIHSLNNGVGEAIVAQCQNSGAPITAGTRVARSLKAMQEDEKNNKLAKKTRQAIRKRYIKRRTLYELHKQKQGAYVKNQSLPLNHNDHSYAKKR